MNIPINVLLTSLISLFLLMGVGYFIVRIKLLPASTTGILSTFLLNVALPATIFTSMLREFDTRVLVSCVVILVGALVFYLFSAAISLPASRLFGVPDDRRGTWMMGLTYPNGGFMGFPIVLALLGEDALMLAVMMNISFNLLVYTLGVKQILCDHKGQQSVEIPSMKKLLFTMVNLSTLLGLVFFCLQLSLPTAILSPITSLSGITTPLSMIVVGMNIAKGDIKEVFGNKPAFTAVLMRLVLLPLIAWMVLHLIPFSDPLIAPVMRIILAMPAASIGCVLAERYNGDVKLASHITFLSSLLCIVTIPLICMLP